MDQTPVTDDGNATYTVRPAIPSVETNKNIDRDSITAGQSTGASISGTNGDVPVTELHMADLGFFDAEVTFGGFDGPLGWPADADDATITYRLLGGGIEPLTVTRGQTPTPPTAAISGFEITWSGPIQANETGGADFTIDTTEDATGGATEVSLTNTVATDVTAPNGLTDSASDSDRVRIVDPRIETTLTKTVRPSSAVAPGESVISSLAANVIAQGDGSVVNEILVQDAVGAGSAEFWNAFDLTSIAPTQVPAATTLTVEVQDVAGTWQTLTVYGPERAATVFQFSETDLSAALVAIGLTPGDVTGIRFGFENAEGFPANTTVTPNVEFTARGDLRGGGEVTPGPDAPTPYTNMATVEADGVSEGGRPLNDEDLDTGVGTIETDDGGPGPGVDITKAWNKTAVNAQSSDQAATNLDWNVGRGFSPVTIADVAQDPATTPVADTVFDAFDLLRVEPVAASSDPYTNGWWLRYDTVTRLDLYDGTTWTTVPAPGGSWMTGGRDFKGYTLTDAQRASTLSVRIVLEELPADTTARQAAQQTGPAFDPFAPKPGTGVGSGSADRRFSLVWQVRDTTRSDGSFVVEDSLYNTPDEGIVDNTTSVTGIPTAGGPAVSDTDADTIAILDPEPGVAITKSVTPTTPIFTPPVGTDPATYPTATWRMVAHNSSTARASYVRVTDPATCTDTSVEACQSDADPAGATTDPFDTSVDYLTDASLANPFESFDATKITLSASLPAQVDLAATTVWLLRYSDGSYTTETTTAAAVNSATATDLADVVGVSATFQGADPTTTGGTITQDNNLSVVIDTRLRPTLRSSGEDQVLRAGDTVSVENRAFAQSYDPVTSPGTPTGDVADATAVLTGGAVNISPSKSVSPTLINEPRPDVPVTVTLGANQGADPRSTLSPQRVVIEDQAQSPDFWNTFGFTGLDAVTLPNGADQVQVDVYDGTAWVLGAAGPTAVKPASVPDVEVQGVRFTFSRSDGALFSTVVPAPNWSASARFTVQLRETYRDSAEPVAFDGTVANTQTSQSTRPDGNDSEEKDADAVVELSPGTHEIAVNKLTNEGNRLASVGDAVPFDLTFENTGTGFLTVSQLRDALPEELLYTGEPTAEFVSDDDGLLSEDVTITPAADGSSLTFTWPNDGNQMSPGEVFRIRLYLELQPGLGVGETATNTMTVETEEDLRSCRNIQPGGSLTDDWDNDKSTCGTSDYVGSIAGPNLYNIKGVRGSLPGAYVPGNPRTLCAPTLRATPGDTVAGDGRFFRPTCVANSQVGGTDDWVLHNVNTGTINIEEMTIFDQLPVTGDRQLVSGGPRGSQFRPQLVADSLKVTAPAGTTQVIEVTTSPNVCVDTWTDLTTQPVCEQAGEVWELADADTDWSQVSGLRIDLDFRTSAAGSLRAGQAADVNFSTTNVLESGADDSGASRTVPAADQLAWNQHGVKFKYVGLTGSRKLAPSRVGVHLRFGAIQVVKEVTGPAAAYAPDEFLADVACRIGEDELDLGDDATVSLSEDDDFTARLDGIPLGVAGTSCTVTEQGDTGEFGETTRTGTPVTLELTEPSYPEPLAEPALVPGAQVATIRNDYQFTELSVTKRVDTVATGVQFDRFEFSLRCRSVSGMNVRFDDEGATTLRFTLTAGGTFAAPENRIPVGATCTLTEDDALFADDIVVTGDNVVDNGDGTAQITPGIEPAAVVVTNAYDAGTVTIAKVVDGAGANLHGTGAFTFDVTCTYQGQTPYQGTIELRGGGSRTLGPFPVGTQCATKETATAGATSATLSPAGGVVSVPAAGADGGTTNVAITATNTFDVTSLDVEKVVAGDLTADGAKGPFTVTLGCTWLVDGTRQPVAVPGGADRTLSSDNGYAARYADLPSSSECSLTETDDGGAAATSMESKVDARTTRVPSDSIAVDLSGTKGPGNASVVVTNTFAEDPDNNDTDTDTDGADTDTDTDINGEDINGEDNDNGGTDGQGSNTGEELPDTGAPFGPWLLGMATLMLLTGATLVVNSRRRRV